MTLHNVATKGPTDMPVAAANRLEALQVEIATLRTKLDILDPMIS